MRDDEDDDRLPRALEQIAADERWELPAESRAVLVDGLQNGDREVRLEALEVLADSLDDGLAAMALELARGEGDEAVRVAAALALGPGLGAAAAASEDEIAAPISQATVAALGVGLRQLYFDSTAPKAVRRAALEAATQAPDAWQEGAVRAASPLVLAEDFAEPALAAGFEALVAVATAFAAVAAMDPPNNHDNGWP